MRSLWTGAISFGLVNIPVKIFSAVQDSALDLDMLDGRDHANIKFKRVNENTGKEVPYEQIVRAYMMDGKYVVLDKEDFISADAEKTKTIDIINFVDESEINSIYYEHPYYLEPEKQGVKAYALLREALRQTGKAGVTTFVMRNKEVLAILKPYKNVIVLNCIRFEEEIKDPSELKLPAAAAKAMSKELAMAGQLIEQRTEKFDISAYKDTYTAKLLKVIKAKAKSGGKKIKPKLQVVHKQSSDDLMGMLKASLERRKSA